MPNFYINDLKYHPNQNEEVAAVVSTMAVQSQWLRFRFLFSHLPAVAYG